MCSSYYSSLIVESRVWDTVSNFIEGQTKNVVNQMGTFLFFFRLALLCTYTIRDVNRPDIQKFQFKSTLSIELLHFVCRRIRSCVHMGVLVCISEWNFCFHFTCKLFKIEKKKMIFFYVVITIIYDLLLIFFIRHFYRF